MARGQSGGNVDPGTRLVLEELRDLRVEMRADRRQAEADRRQSDERFEQALREFREDSVRREAAAQKILAGIQQAFKDIRTIGLAIVKTLNRHTRILEHHTTLLERIDRKLGAPRQDGRGT
ncbi:MAG TPA: hypothetical protein VMT79_10070 [Candidatus Binatia bacterium]|nr:hypothetical protein [Candidatus Binatia bacterium]